MNPFLAFTLSLIITVGILNPKNSAHAQLYNLPHQQLVQQAESGDSDSQVELGIRYIFGNREINSDLNTAYLWLERANQQGNLNAHYSLCVLLFNGYNYLQSSISNIDSKNFGHCLWAARLGNPDAMHYLLEILTSDYHEKKLLTEAEYNRIYAQIMIRAAKRGNSYLQYNLAMSYLHGVFGLPKNLQKHDYWIHEAARNLSPIAIFRLGLDEQEACRCNQTNPWLVLAAERNYGLMHQLLGLSYLFGKDRIDDFILDADGVTDQLLALGGIDYEKSEDWLRSASDQGLPAADYYLGTIYEQGLGRPKDLQKAFDYYLQSAKFYYPKAVIALARFYQEGLGTSINCHESYYYFAIAERLKFRSVQSELKNLEKTCSADAIAAAKARLVDFKIPKNSHWRNQLAMTVYPNAMNNVNFAENFFHYQLGYSWGLTLKSLNNPDDRFFKKFTKGWKGD